MLIVLFTNVNTREPLVTLYDIEGTHATTGVSKGAPLYFDENTG